MKITDYRCIKSLSLPDGWVENEIRGGVQLQIVRSFSPPNHEAVKMELFYRGLPVNGEAAISFRRILKLAPKMIFNRQIRNVLGAVEAQLISELKSVLGHVGNNQLVNKENGLRGPAFLLDGLEVLPWNGRPLISARGCFQDSEAIKRTNEFYGFFIDSNPNDTACSIEQIYLEAPDEELFKRYLPVFKQSLISLQWSN